MFIALYYIIYTYIYTYTHTYIHTYIHTYVHTYLCVCVCVYIYILYIHTYIYTYIYIYTYKYVSCLSICFLATHTFIANKYVPSRLQGARRTLYKSIHALAINMLSCHQHGKAKQLIYRLAKKHIYCQ
jgi:hypothetical protein